MEKLGLSSITAISIMTVLTSTVSADNGLETILGNGKYSLELRPRYEFVDQDPISNQANAFTVRTAIGAKFDTLGVKGLSTEVEMMDVRNFGADNYAPETGGYPVVADGEQTRVTQANISYAKDGLVAVVGRKGVNLDNQRFIGTVGWRQMPQTYDLALVGYNGAENLDLKAAYISQVNRIFDRDLGGLKVPDFNTNSVLLHASYKVSPALKLTAYDYMTASFADHVGLRATGNSTLSNEIKLNYTAEYAKQMDASLKEKTAPFNDAKPKQDADYYKVELKGSKMGYSLEGSYEVLGEKGSGTNAFGTPLATLHAMNGWADKFLATPADGLTDMALNLGYANASFGKLMGVYHKFDSDIGSVDYGSEFDLVYVKPVMKNLKMMLKGAIYSQGDATTAYTDTSKYWMMFDYKL